MGSVRLSPASTLGPGSLQRRVRGEAEVALHRKSSLPLSGNGKFLDK